MCRLCSKILNGTAPKDRDDLMKAVAVEMAVGVPAEHFDVILGEVTDTAMKPRDLELERIYEKERKARQ